MHFVTDILIPSALFVEQQSKRVSGISKGVTETKNHKKIQK